MKLYVAGCSFSDNLLSPRNYGSKLAALLGYEYVHKAKGIGSNHRMWRHITNAVMNGELTNKDLLVVQYTNTERREFWSVIPRNRPEEHADVSEHYSQHGTVLKFKMDSHTWQSNSIEKDFMKLYQDNFLSPKFEREVFDYNNFMFQSMLAYYNIPTIFYASRYLNDYSVINEFKDTVYYEPQEFIRDESTYMDIITDRYHLNDEGHTKVAELLFNHIKEKNVCQV